MSLKSFVVVARGSAVVAVIGLEVDRVNFAAAAAAAGLLNCRLSQTEAYQETESRLDGEGWRVRAR